MICSHCGERGPEYGAMWHCRLCGDDVCPDCSVESDEETAACLCKPCAAVCVCCARPSATRESGDPLCQDHYEKHLLDQRIDEDCARWDAQQVARDDRTYNDDDE